MNTKDYIDSGILELYVYGALSEEESRDVTEFLKNYPEVEAEVEAIEASLNRLSASVAPYNPEALLTSLKDKLNKSSKVKSLPATRKLNTPALIGWAACIALICGLFYLFSENNSLRDRLRYQQTQTTLNKGKIEVAEKQLANTQELLSALRSQDFNEVALGGQKIDTAAYATIYWSTETNTAYVDADGLPKAPRGKVYQVWSLTLNPLSPTSIGLLNGTEISNGVYKLNNTNSSEAFGITLEPKGGSDSPTMDQLYVLGAISS